MDEVDEQGNSNSNLENFLSSEKSFPQKDVSIDPRPAALLGHGLEFENLSYNIVKKQKKDGVSVKKEVHLLRDISGQAFRGEILAIMGPSGAGKSTFLDALAGRIARGRLEGSVRIEGNPVSPINCSC